ncbi:phytoene/squalene synthase family protein [Bacteroidota bacterium]
MPNWKIEEKPEFMDLYLKTSLNCSKLITNNYSTSFSIGIKSLHKKYHKAIYALYGFVRFADEIVDTFYDHNRENLLSKFKKDTFEAINNKISSNPVLHSFQWIVNDYNINHELIHAFLKSMEMDLKNNSYDRSGYDEYIYGSAEVVGLMCLRVFYKNDDDNYEKLSISAKKLGQAFQKVNFLRDIKHDYHLRSRVYFPKVDFENFTNEDKVRIEKEIQKNFEEALTGILSLKKGVRFGVFVAYSYYLALFKKIQNASPEKISNMRFRISNFRKLVILIKAYILLPFKY